MKIIWIEFKWLLAANFILWALRLMDNELSQAGYLAFEQLSQTLKGGPLYD